MTIPQKKALIIDVCAGSRCRLHETLVQGNLAVTHAHLDENFSLLAEDVIPDIILFYYNNKSRGDLFWKTVTAVAPLNDMPILIITSLVDENFLAKIVESGVNHFIQVPCTKEYLLATIARLINGFTAESLTDQINVSVPRGLDRLPFQATLGQKQFGNLIASLAGNSIHQHGILAGSTRGKKRSERENADPKVARMIADVRAALDAGNFQLYFQPVYSLESDQLTGFESLIRWIDPVKGLIPPDDFIPVVERTEMIMDLGFWIIEEAMRQARRFNDEFPDTGPFSVNINLAARQFNHPHLAETIMELSEKWNAGPDIINFEITEGAFMDDMEQANLMLLKLKKEGFKIYMDDFGTGYSSLTYLLHFPVDCIKVDKSFVQWMHIEEDSQHIVRSVIFLAHNLRIKVVTEGVENEEHVAILKEMGSDYAQGYFYSRPMKLEDTLLYLKNYSANKPGS